jgi:malate/lactate dehydrogenase
VAPQGRSGPARETRGQQHYHSCGFRDERAVIPVGCYSAKYGVTLSLPSVIGRRGVVEMLEPDLSKGEQMALQRSAETLRRAVQQIGE